MLCAIIAVKSESDTETTLKNIDLLREFAEFNGLHVTEETSLNPSETVESVFPHLGMNDILLIQNIRTLANTQEEVLKLLRLLSKGVTTVVVPSDSGLVTIDNMSMFAIELIRLLYVKLLMNVARRRDSSNAYIFGNKTSLFLLLC